MKKLYMVLSFFLLLFLTNCTQRIQHSKEKSIEQSNDEDLVQYNYVVSISSPLFEEASTDSRQLDDLMPGDTISCTGKPIELTEWRLVEYKGYRVYAYNPYVYAVASKRYPKGTKISFKPATDYPVQVASQEVSSPSSGYTPSTGATIHTGPRGGRYYINRNGNKTYISSKRSSSSGSYRSRSSSYRSGGGYRRR
ncbi:hypothetical protein DYU11_07305 [Fibrisoma montanum]|uniref:Uncharacterized protein n=1 Tax=Fibrisoma montanum TaxID=2305895 RepID=A0A418MEF7_9BACT|nr:hypothetical protein [Fibrisoma montanum]RIV25117.1 hypothetical protein DYU11_07305 [Fibrisoma montanum]